MSRAPVPQPVTDDTSDAVKIGGSARIPRWFVYAVLGMLGIGGASAGTLAIRNEAIGVSSEHACESCADLALEVQAHAAKLEEVAAARQRDRAEQQAELRTMRSEIREDLREIKADLRALSSRRR